MTDFKLKQLIAFGMFSLLLAFNSTAATPTSVTVAWDPSSEANVAGYRVHYGTASGNYDRTIDAGASVTASLRDLAPGTTYYFVVTAYNDVGIESSPSSEISHAPAIVPSLRLTSSPHSQVATRGSSVTLSVSATGSGPLTYQWNKAGTPITGATGPAYTITNLSAATIGAYSVTVFDDNSSLASPTVSVSAMQMPKPGQIVIDGVPGASFAVSYAENLASNMWSQITNVELTSNSVQWVDTSASNEIQRFYRVTPQ